MRRLTTTVLLVLLCWLPAAGAAQADPAGPTNYRSTITSAPDDGIEVTVFGGDAFLVVEAEPGHEVIVYGYDNRGDNKDLYLRISADGTVEVNRRSPARWKNNDRYQAVEIPDFVDPTAPPEWEVVATDGAYAWHDHRIHWMSPALPPTIDPDGGEQVVPALADWRVPIVVDGVETEIAGTLTWTPSVTPVPWIALALIVAALVGFIAVRSPRQALMAVMAASLAVLLVGIGLSIKLPPGVGIVLPLVLLPAVSVGAAATGRTRPERHQMIFAVLAAAPLLVWAIIESGALTSPIVPSATSAANVRLGLAVSVGTFVGLIGAGLASLFGGDLADLADLADAADQAETAG